MQTTVVDHHKSLPAWKSPWVVAWIALVIAVLGVNGVMVYFAVATNPGLVVEDFYERGQNYEHTMLSKDARNPGWTLRADIPQEIVAGVPSAIRFFLVDKAGQPVTPESVELFVYRPSDAARDFSIVMTQEGPGRYLANVSFPLIGAWDILLAARYGEDEFHVGQRVDVGRP
jgi:nitrogen fixation protein FixH